MSSKLESDVCCHLQVAPSGESYEGKRRPGRKQQQTKRLIMIYYDCLYDFFDELNISPTFPLFLSNNINSY